MRRDLSRIGRNLWQLVARPYPVDHTTEEQRYGLQMLWWDGILSSISVAFFTDFETLYLLALGASSATIGARASLTSGVALLAPLVGAWLVSRTGKRKKWVLLSAGGIGRIALLLSALAPLLVVRSGPVVAMVLALAAIRAFMGSVSVPPFNSLLGDLTPTAIRGRITGARMMAASAVTVLTLPVAGFLIQNIGGVGGFQVTLMLAALFGFAATAFFARIPEVQGEESRAAASAGFAEGLRHFRHDKTFVLFCIINFVWTLGLQISAPFFSVHMVETLGFGVDTISLLATITTLCNVFVVRFAGNLVDKKGAERVTALGMLLVPLMPLGWILARTPFTVGLVRIYGIIAWAGVHVAAMPLMLRITPARYRSQFIAIYNTINGIAAIIGPLPAAWLYATYGFNSNLILSAAVRLVGALLFLIALLRGSLGEGETPSTRALPSALTRG
jgi:MFS family permease